MFLRATDRAPHCKDTGLAWKEEERLIQRLFSSWRGLQGLREMEVASVPFRLG